jgi:hypothetical protein
LKAKKKIRVRRTFTDEMKKQIVEYANKTSLESAEKKYRTPVPMLKRWKTEIIPQTEFRL